MEKNLKLQFFISLILPFMAAVNCFSFSQGFTVLELYSDTFINIPKTAFQKQNPGLSTFKLIYGAHLTSGPFDVRWYQGTETVRFETPQSFESISDYQSIFKSPAWSVSFDATRTKASGKNIPVSISAGTLSYSQIVSRLNTPGFYSSPSPFASFPSFNSGLGMSQAQKTASEKPVSIYAALKKSDFSMQAAVLETCDVKLSAGFEWQPGDFIKNKTSCGFTTFTLSPKAHSSWKNSSLTFSPELNCGTYLESIFSMPLFTAKISGGFVTNPFESIRFHAGFESLFHYSIFSLGIGAYTSDYSLTKNPAPFYTASGDISKTICQFRLSPKLTFYTGKKSSINIGITAFLDYSFGEFAYNQHSTEKLGLSSGISMILPDDRFTLSYRAQNIILAEYTGNDSYLHSPFEFSDPPSDQDITHTFSAKYTHSFDSLTMTLQAKETFSENSLREKKEHSETFGISVYPKNCPLTSAVFTTRLDHKNGSTSPVFTLGISNSFPLKNIKITGKFKVCSAVVVE